MPAITAETLTLPRLPQPGPEQVDRPLLSVTTAPSWLIRGLDAATAPARGS